MLTNLTRSISIDAPPEVVLGFVGDGGNLPRWAPAFAQGAQRDGDHWIVDSAGAQLRIEVRASPEHGTVDFLAAGAPPERVPGVFTRVVHNGRGSEYIFTRFLPAEATGEDIDREAAVIGQELEAVRARCEAPAGGVR